MLALIYIKGVNTLSSSSSKTKNKRKRLNAVARRQQLIDLAISLTAQKGIGQARHADIAELADVAVSTVFFYFPSVKILNHAVIDEVEHVVNSVCLNEIVISGQDCELSALLNVYYKTFKDLINTNKDFTTIFLEWGSAINNSAWPRYLAFRDKHIAFTKETLTRANAKGELKDGLDLDATAILISSVLSMMFKMSFFDGTQSAISELNKSLRNHIFK